MSKQETAGDSGVEILVNEPFEDPTMGKGQYTHKIYHLGSRVPRFVAALCPASMLKLEEKAWNAYPYCKTILTNQFLGEKFILSVETKHAEGAGEIENIHSLPADKWKSCEVIHLDIGKDELEPKDYKEEFDPKKFKSEKTGRGPLVGDWKKDAKPLMTCYKLITIKFKVFGFETRTESMIAKEQYKLLLKFHQQLFCLLDKWFGLTMEDIRALEEKAKQDLDKKLQELNMESRK